MFITPSFFMLRAGEEKTSLDCGCTLYHTINTVFAYCPLHDSASALLEALENLTGTADTVMGCLDWPEYQAAIAIIAQAKKIKQSIT